MAKALTHVFDCDGVIIASNGVKADAFYRAALPYGDGPAHQLREYHRRAGNASRRERLEHFFARILFREPEEGEVDALYERVSEEVVAGVLAAPLVPGVEAFLERLEGRAVCVSGVVTDELKHILKERGLLQHFAHVYGGPRRKAEILRLAIGRERIALPAVYYGDTADDHAAAEAAGLDFVFVTCNADTTSWAPRSVRRIADFTPAPTKRRVRVDRRGYVEVNGEMRFIGRNLAGAEVLV